MSATLVPGPARQSLILAAIAGLHVGAFILVSLGLVPHIPLPELAVASITNFRERPQPTLPVKPDDFRAGEYEINVQREPVLAIPDFNEPPPVPFDDRGSTARSAGAGPFVPPADIRSPGLRTGDNRMKALIDGCYPTASRRLSEEGRDVARVAIGADGRPASSTVAQGSGFPRLDAATDCVIRRLEFVAGQRDGRAVEVTVLLPIVFQLH